MHSREREASGRPRLLVLASTYPRWRADTEPSFVHELCRRLVARFDVHVLTPHAPGALEAEILDGVAVSRFRYAPLRWQVLVHGGGILTNLKRKPWLWILVVPFGLAMTVAFRRLIARLQPNVVHAHWLVPQGLVAAIASSKSVPLVITSHGADLHGLRSPFFRWIKRFVARRANALTVVSRAMVERVRELGVHGQNVSVAPMGVDLTSRFTVDTGVPRAAGELLFVGRLVEKKGLRFLIEALPLILERHPNARLRIVGSGPELGLLQSLSCRLGVDNAIRFDGPIPNSELAAAYRRASIVVLPFVRAKSGDEEGLGLVLVEAIGCGCPVIVGKVAAIYDVIEAGDPALVDVRDRRALAQGINDILDDPGSALDAAARRRRRTVKFDWVEVAAGYAELLEGLSKTGRQ